MRVAAILACTSLDCWARMARLHRYISCCSCARPTFLTSTAPMELKFKIGLDEVLALR